MDREELSARLLGLFIEELEEHVRSWNADLLALEADPSDSERLRSLFRAAHTLKGAARAAGVTEVEIACHAAEELLVAARDGVRPLDPDSIQLLFTAADDLEDAAVRLRAGRSLVGAPIHYLPEQLGGSVTERRSKTAPPAAAPEPEPVRAEPEAPSAPEPIREAPEEVRPPVPDTREMVPVRVSPERLDSLLAASGETVALGRRAGARAAELRRLEEFVAQWSSQWERESAGLRRRIQSVATTDQEGDPTQPVREQIGRLGERVRRLARDAAVDARQLARSADLLVGQVRSLRMRPLREAFETLPRTVRDLAAAAGKEVRLEVQGEDVEVDRVVLEALREALLPVVRNAIDHGLESPDERARAGKPSEGTLRVEAELRGDRVIVTVVDDGGGLDAPRLRKRLAATGAPVPEDDEDFAKAILSGGVSSRERATAISGRGVGLDIVRASMHRVRGRIALSWEPGRGTRVKLEFPPSLASLRALLVGVSGQVLAIPTLAVERLHRIPVASLPSMEGRPVLMLPDGPIPLVSLARLLGPPLIERPLSETARAVVLATAGGRTALLVDDFIGEEELLLRPIATGKVALPLIAGAATLSSGGVAPLLDAAGLMEAARLGAAAVPILRHGPVAAPRRILIADDSLTTRALEQSLLEAAGFIVLTAVDGLEALRLLQEESVDLLVSDVEMPRMDGFRLCETVRANPRLRELPVVLVTARESEEDRARGLEAGADAYLPKSSFDQEQLLQTVQQLLD